MAIAAANRQTLGERLWFLAHTMSGTATSDAEVRSASEQRDDALRRAAQNGAVGGDRDRTLDEDRVLGHRLDQCRVVRGFEARSA